MVEIMLNSKGPILLPLPKLSPWCLARSRKKHSTTICVHRRAG